MSIIEDSAKSMNVALHDFGQANAIDVFLENIDFDVKTDTPFLAGFQLDVDLDELDLNYNESVGFIYQIDVNYASHIGSAVINRMVDSLRSVFHTGSVHQFGSACIDIQSFTVSGVRVDNGWATRSISLECNGITPRV